MGALRDKRLSGKTVERTDKGFRLRATVRDLNGVAENRNNFARVCPLKYLEVTPNEKMQVSRANAEASSIRPCGLPTVVTRLERTQNLQLQASRSVLNHGPQRLHLSTPFASSALNCGTRSVAFAEVRLPLSIIVRPTPHSHLGSNQHMTSHTGHCESTRFQRAFQKIGHSAVCGVRESTARTTTIYKYSRNAIDLKLASLVIDDISCVLARSSIALYNLTALVRSPHGIYAGKRSPRHKNESSNTQPIA